MPVQREPLLEYSRITPVNSNLPRGPLGWSLDMPGIIANKRHLVRLDADDRAKASLTVCRSFGRRNA